MEIEIFDNDIEKEEAGLENKRVACRGIVKKDDLYLVVTLKKWDITTFPGGGLEENETLEECAVREVLEETGIHVKVVEKKVSITEYFVDSVWTNHYFICDYISDSGENKLTEEEIDLELIKSWKSMDELLDLFENNPSLHKHGSNIHQREFLGFINSI